MKKKKERGSLPPADPSGLVEKYFALAVLQTPWFPLKPVEGAQFFRSPGIKIAVSQALS